MRRWMRSFGSNALAAAVALIASTDARADGLLAHDTIAGGALDVMDLVAPGGKTTSMAFTQLGAPLPPATYTLRLSAAGDSVLVPHCNGRGAVSIDGVVR